MFSLLKCFLFDFGVVLATRGAFGDVDLFADGTFLD